MKNDAICYTVQNFGIEIGTNLIMTSTYWPYNHQMRGGRVFNLEPIFEKTIIFFFLIITIIKL